ncbi:MAG: EamA family transporter [Candidatus Woesearchaeota archaeon]
MLIVPILLVVFGTIIGSFGALILKLGSSSITFGLRDFLKNWKLLLGVMLYGISTIPFLIALKNAPLSVLYPITSLSYVWTALLSVKVLGERMNFWKYASISSIILGVLLISIS